MIENYSWLNCIYNYYSKQAQQWHPDNFNQSDEVAKKAAEKKFIDIAAAKEVLTDPGKSVPVPVHPLINLSRRFLWVLTRVYFWF